MLGPLLTAVLQSLTSASVQAGEARAARTNRAYYNGVVQTIVILAFAMFVVFAIAGIVMLIQGQEGAWMFALLGTGIAGFGGWGLLNNLFGRSATWDENGVHFRWWNGGADLAWNEIEKIEIRPFSRAGARITFKDGQKYSFTNQFTGGNILLRELTRHGIPVFKWGTSKPLEPRR
jgi:hypothetical protein